MQSRTARPADSARQTARNHETRESAQPRLPGNHLTANPEPAGSEQTSASPPEQTAPNPQPSRGESTEQLPQRPLSPVVHAATTESDDEVLRIKAEIERIRREYRRKVALARQQSLQEQGEDGTPSTAQAHERAPRIHIEDAPFAWPFDPPSPPPSGRLTAILCEYWETGYFVPDEEPERHDA
ncbi:DNA ligase I, mitochondrial precursor [Colletotrichum sp. SAR11_239]|nr:DNA ligase I, mitochondrial precursor [Colletotrichum sp. SAR11_239]